MNYVLTPPSMKSVLASPLWSNSQEFFFWQRRADDGRQRLATPLQPTSIFSPHEAPVTGSCGSFVGGKNAASLRLVLPPWSSSALRRVLNWRLRVRAVRQSMARGDLLSVSASPA